MKNQNPKVKYALKYVYTFLGLIKLLLFRNFT